jgi:tetratricopeptide (TPR) repeat protein
MIPEAESRRAEQLGRMGVQEVIEEHAAPPDIVEAIRRAKATTPAFTGHGRVPEGELRTLEALVRETPDSGEARWLLGFAYYRCRRFREAQDLLERVVDEDREHLDARYYLGSCSYRLGQNERAIEAWQQVVDLKPESMQAKRAISYIDKIRGEKRTL